MYVIVCKAKSLQQSVSFDIVLVVQMERHASSIFVLLLQERVFGLLLDVLLHGMVRDVQAYLIAYDYTNGVVPCGTGLGMADDGTLRFRATVANHRRGGNGKAR